jgi:hypothetical protein
MRLLRVDGRGSLGTVDERSAAWQIEWASGIVLAHMYVLVRIKRSGMHACAHSGGYDICHSSLAREVECSDRLVASFDVYLHS